MTAIVFGLIGLWAMGLGHTAQAIDLDRAKTAYEAQCSKCHGLIERETQGRPEALPGMQIASNDRRFVVALPYGPSLRGVYGRTAGTMPGFSYSQVFKEVLHDVVWQADTLERWITDSQKWARGARMYYRQPDAEIRRRIIAYLKAHSP
jgi:cytochrome c